MSRMLVSALLATVLAFLVAPIVSAADKPPAKKPPVAAKAKPPRHEKAARTKPAVKEQSHAAVQPVVAGSNEAIIEQALAMPTEMAFSDTPLRDVVDYLMDYHSQKLGHRFLILLDHKALNDAGVANDQPITMSVKGISLRSALNLMLRDLNLTWIIDNEVLLITTPEVAENRLMTKAYDVADLVVCRDSKGKLWDEYDSLTDLIKSTVMPTTWDDVGGPGSICPADMGTAKAIVVSQTRRVHEEIADVLAKIREVAKKDPNAGPPVRDREPPKVRQEPGQHAGASTCGAAPAKDGKPDGKKKNP